MKHLLRTLELTDAFLNYGKSALKIPVAIGIAVLWVIVSAGLVIPICMCKLLGAEERE